MAPDEAVPEYRLHQLVQAIGSQRLWRARSSFPRDAYRQSFIAHAVNTVPYYRALSQTLGISKDSFIDQFPVFGKEDVFAAPNSFISEAFNHATLVHIPTSGTDGKPLTVSRDRVSWYGFVFEAHAAVAEYIPPFAKALRRGELGLVLLNDNPVRQAWKMVNPSINYAIVEKVILGTVEAEDQAAIRRFRDVQVPLLYGGPRKILRLAELDEAIGSNRRRISPRAVLSSGDNLYEDDRRYLENWYQCKVHNAYATTEGGFIGVECENQAGIHIFPKRAMLEVLQEDGTIAHTGTGELLVTNFENWAMPFIRYRTGDWGTLTEGTCSCGYVGISITELHGRDSPYFTVGTRRIPPAYLDVIFEALPVRQFQVIQEAPLKFRVRWVPRPAVQEVDRIQELIEESIQNRLGDADVVVERVERIGKRRQKVPRYVRQLDSVRR